MEIRKTLTAALLVGLIFFGGSAALSQEGGDVNSTVAQMASTIQDLQFSMESLKGMLETNNHIVKSQAQDFDLKVKELEARLSSLEEKLAIQGKQVTSAVSTVAPEAAAEAELYQSALNQINASEFLKAVATFKKFQTKFPKSEYTSSAQYWIGECYFAMRDYEQSIKEFQALRDSYTRSDKIPAAMLKQGYAFFELGMDNEGKLFLNDLIRRYPHSKEASEAKTRMDRITQMKQEAAAKKQNTPGGVPLAPGVEVKQDKKTTSTPTRKEH